jgi:hypothetical protein
MEPLTLLTVFAPAAIDAVKALVNRFIAPDVFKPATIEQYQSMRQVDLEMFKALNEAGGANPSYPWVEASVRLMRPVVAVSVVLAWVLDQGKTPEINNMAAAIGFYLFGDRTLFYSRKGFEK